MKSFERARRFLTQKGRMVAISILPLATLAPTCAFATPTVHGFGNNGTCSVTSVNLNASAGGGCFTTSDGTNPDNGFLGAKMYGNNSSEPFATNFEGSTFFGVDISTGVQAANVSQFEGAIPVSWNFSATNTDGHDLSYVLTYTLFGFSGNTQLPNQTQGTLNTIGTLTESTASGTGQFNLLPNESVTGYSMDLQVTETGTGTITVHIPSNSIDINQSTATPEPASFLLLGAGLGGLLLRRVRRAR